MRIRLDTNVVCRLAERGHPHHAPAKGATAKLEAAGHTPCLVPQVLYEYWVVVTRPVAENGLGMSTADADQAIDLWLDLFTLIRDERGILSLWRDLARQHDVKGTNAHDARLVSAMLRHGIAHLLTFNVGDFARFPEITVHTPEQVLAGTAL